MGGETRSDPRLIYDPTDTGHLENLSSGVMQLFDHYLQRHLEGEKLVFLVSVLFVVVVVVELSWF